ncbi:MAG: RNA-binding S4 domain-containing protein [Clostridia bacterium]|nr:RNA-binding S4 domain-containing protein [Clostridia bacterium]
MTEITINTATIRLDQFIKWAGITATGGQAKEIIALGLVKVNGQIEKHRSHLLAPGDEVIVKGVCYRIKAAPTD